MKIKFRPYQRRDGSLMLYMNRSNGVSVGVSADRDFMPYGKGSTQGMRNVYDAACAVIRKYGVPFTGDLAKHTEAGLSAPLRLANGWTMVGTDVANIGGMSVEADGGYIVADGRIISMAFDWDECE